MIFTEQIIQGIFLIKPEAYEDSRGSFRRTFCNSEFKKNNIDFSVNQGNISENINAYTMRGFHYQRQPYSEAKILTPITGKIYNVVVDLRHSSRTFLKYFSLELSSEKRESLYIPPGCANAFLTMKQNTIIHYYMGDYFKPELYSGFRYNDPFFNIHWPQTVKVISERDNSFPDFNLDLL